MRWFELIECPSLVRKRMDGWAGTGGLARRLCIVGGTGAPLKCMEGLPLPGHAWRWTGGLVSRAEHLISAYKHTLEGTSPTRPHHSFSSSVVSAEGAERRGGKGQCDDWAGFQGRIGPI